MDHRVENRDFIRINSFPEDQFEENFEVPTGNGQCPSVFVSQTWDIGLSQGDWYLYFSGNNYASQGCVGCSTMQISLWDWLGGPQYVMNNCCLLSCANDKVKTNGGVNCGVNLGSGFITPEYANNPNIGALNYELGGQSFGIKVLGFEQNEFFIYYGCEDVIEQEFSTIFHRYRIYTRSPNPSASVQAKIQSVANRYPFTDFNYIPPYQYIYQGPQCIYA